MQHTGKRALSPPRSHVMEVVIIVDPNGESQCHKMPASPSLARSRNALGTPRVDAGQHNTRQTNLGATVCLTCRFPDWRRASSVRQACPERARGAENRRTSEFHPPGPPPGQCGHLRAISRDGRRHAFGTLFGRPHERMSRSCAATTCVGQNNGLSSRTVTSSEVVGTLAQTGTPEIRQSTHARLVAHQPSWSRRSAPAP